jgi:hypothetical protein
MAPDRASRGQIADVFEEIAAAEGPIVAEQVYRRYMAASNVNRMGKNIRAAFDGAMSELLQRGRVVQLDDGAAELIQATVRTPAQADVVARQRGDRDLLMVPKSEVREVIRLLGLGSDLDSGYLDDTAKRRILEFYGRTSLTKQASRTLDECVAYRWGSGG